MTSQKALLRYIFPKSAPWAYNFPIDPENSQKAGISKQVDELRSPVDG